MSDASPLTRETGDQADAAAVRPEIEAGTSDVSVYLDAGALEAAGPGIVADLRCVAAPAEPFTLDDLQAALLVLSRTYATPGIDPSALIVTGPAPQYVAVCVGDSWEPGDPVTVLELVDGKYVETTGVISDVR